MVNAVVNFKVAEVNGASKQEALEQAPFEIVCDVTRRYSAWRDTLDHPVSTNERNRWMLDFLEKETKLEPGKGFVITLDAAVVDKKTHPYKVNNVINTKGKRKYVTSYMLVDDVNGQLLATVEDSHGKAATKALAIQTAKSLYTEHGLTHSITCYYIQKCVAGESIAFKMDYSPSKNTRSGVYLVFGIEA